MKYGKVPSTEIEKLYNNRYYHKVVSLYEQPNFINLYDVCNDGNAYYYAALSYVALGRFDEAIQVLKDCISIYGNTEFGYYKRFYNVVLMVDFYKKDFLNMFYDSLPNNTTFCDIKGLLVKRIIPSLCVDAPIIKSDPNYAKRFRLSKSKLMEHVDEKHGKQFKIPIEDIYKIVIKNLNKAPTYYSNFTTIRVFSCAGTGQIRVTLKGKKYRFRNDFIVVVTSSFNSKCIITFYPTTRVGDMSFYDISNQLSNKSEFYRHGFNKRGEERVRKFYERQAGKKK